MSDIAELLQPAQQLMAKPVLSWDEFWVGLLGLPPSSAEMLARANPAPRFFLLGRRRYIRTEDAIVWLDEVAAAHPYFPRRNRRTSEVES